MPYIKPHKRDELDPAVDQILNALRGLESDDPGNDTEGNLNYVISSLLSKIYPGSRYAEINAAMGVMSSATAEYYRRVAVPYETQKAFENGDVYPSNE